MKEVAEVERVLAFSPDWTRVIQKLEWSALVGPAFVPGHKS